MEIERQKRLTEELRVTQFQENAPRLSLKIGQVRVDVLTNSESAFQRMGFYFAGFQGLGPADAEIFVRVGPDPTLWGDPDPEFNISGDRVFQRDFAAKREPGNRAIAVMDPAVDDAFHNLLRWFLPPFLLTKGCFLMHAAGVANSESSRGFVFFGQSGAGKSTTAALISEADPTAVLLGDDGVIIEAADDGQLWLHAAPLGCGYSRKAPPPVIVPLEGIFALQQDQMHEIRTIFRSEAAAALLASAMSVRFEDSFEERISLALKFADSIYQLRFKKDPGFWPLVLAGSGEQNYLREEAAHV